MSLNKHYLFFHAKMSTAHTEVTAHVYDFLLFCGFSFLRRWHYTQNHPRRHETTFVLAFLSFDSRFFYLCLCTVMPFWEYKKGKIRIIRLLDGYEVGKHVEGTVNLRVNEECLQPKQKFWCIRHLQKFKKIFLKIDQNFLKIYQIFWKFWQKA